VGVEGDPVHVGRAEPRVGEGLLPLGERRVGGDRDRASFLAFGEDLEQQFGSGLVEVEVAQFVQAEQVDAAVAGDGAGEFLLVGGFGEFVDEVRGGCVADAHSGFGDGCADADQQVGLPVPESPIRQRGWPAVTQAGSASVLTCSGVMLGLAA
jgi:hypothetical protein